MMKVGDAIPSFSLEADDGETYGPKDFSGKKLVLYFYPRDNTPGCTREAIAFSLAASKFDGAGIAVVGVSKDTIASHCKFRDQHKLKIPLLSDPELQLHKAFGAYGMKTMYGKKVKGVIRSTFAFDEKGKASHVWKNVKVDGHSEAVLEALTKK